jgi:hypothetical protein
MMWGLAVLLVGAAVVIAGRRHSRYLDRLDELDRKTAESTERKQPVREVVSEL